MVAVPVKIGPGVVRLREISLELQPDHPARARCASYKSKLPEELGPLLHNSIPDCALTLIKREKRRRIIWASLERGSFVGRWYELLTGL